MAFKFVILALTLAYANAGNLIAQPAAVHYSSAPAVSSSYFQQASAPVAYAKTYGAPAVATAQPFAYQAAPVAVHAPSVGISQQAVSRSLGGAQSVSTYSKAVDSAFSSVRKYDTRFTNDALSYAPAQVSYSAPLVTKAYAAPATYASPAPVTYAAPAPVAYAAPAQLVAKTYAAPAQYVSKTYAAPAPVVSYAAPTQYVTKTYSAPAPVASYAAPASLVTKTYGAPASYVSYGAPATYAAPSAYAAPVAYGAPASYAAPVVAKHVSPVATYATGAPVLTKAAVAYSPAGVVAHTAFQGYGIEYHY